MCLGIPAKVVRIEGAMATVEIGGVTREISLMLVDEVSPGEWVVVHAGFAINRVDPDEAELTLNLLREYAGEDTLPR